jgi:hypothetical protein
VIPARAEVRLELDPDPAEILLGGHVDYTATLVIRVGPYQPSVYNNPDTYTYRYDVTGWTRFVIRGDRACKGATCTPRRPASTPSSVPSPVGLDGRSRSTGTPSCT